MWECSDKSSSLNKRSKDGLHETHSDGLVVKVLDFQSRDPCSKPLGDSKVDSGFHPSEVHKMSTKNIWELSGKNYTASSKWHEP